jgi:hypothetical protein
MKFLFGLVLAMTLSTSVVAEVCSTSSYIDQTGTVIQFPICFLRVRNLNATALAAGNVVAFATATTAAFGIDVDRSHVDGYPGACVALEAIAQNAYGRCQTKGYNAAVKFDATSDGGSTVGRAIYMSSTALSAEAMLAGSVTDHKPIGTALEAVTSTGSVKAWLDF